ncbi:FAD/NAD(P)-binding domain-containing protein [Piedraia hortae CBS 480.64]|uniref:FAD/NAD(P)-binding domain-containing protein n=1 Tax=Piedraia hortae CBS 480.64 TaxID=1314780 RepID=A0A6A7BPJ7_9PEZI|nr:FAD/NAD(P)-binding domain-containing protein [Piedraia hortae CBS 480.64]
MTSKISSICIIGAGPSGLAAAKYLLAEKSFNEIVILEARAQAGGIWNYDPEPGPGDQPYISPVYSQLETNIPRGLMGFSDIDWPQDCQLFPSHEEVKTYLDRYAKDVHHLIRFRTYLTNLTPVPDGRWSVTTRHSAEGVQTQCFDAVVVASGHFNVPYIPPVPGLKEWTAAYPNAVLHSKSYRRPETYTSKKVLVVGNSASGSDIATQVEGVCREPLLHSVRSGAEGDTSSRVYKPTIVKYDVSDRTVHFEDGSVESHIDAVIYCTGYRYSFPFITSLDLTNGERVRDTYQHIFYRPNPTLVFPGLNKKIVPFPMAESQAAVIARVFSGRLILPSEEEMERWEREVLADQGDGLQFHVLSFPMDAEYINMCHRWAGAAEGEGKVGKMPLFWGPEQYWIRPRCPEMKKAFAALGPQRHKIRTLKDLGYDNPHRLPSPDQESPETPSKPRPALPV